jgi:predicted DNA-binding transcriptional regulator AlpA
MNTRPKKTPRYISRAEVLDRTGFSFVSIWSWMQPGLFPLSRDVNGKTVWIEAEVDDWMLSRPVKRFKQSASWPIERRTEHTVE